LTGHSFLDEIEIAVEAGRGGNGSVHFARFKFQPKAGPDGGDGGKGGDILLVGDNGLEGLEHLSGRNSWRAADGGAGGGAKMHGADAAALELRLPLGTLVHDGATRFRIAEITQHNQVHVAGRGARGGRGNVHFANAKNKAPRRADVGEAGESKQLALTYRVFAPIALLEDPAVEMQLLQGLMSKRTSSPFRFHQRPRRVRCEFGFNKLDFAFIPLTTREGPRIKFLEHAYFVQRLLVNTLWMDDASADEAYPELMRGLSQVSAPNLNEIWMLCREDPGLPYQVDINGRSISIKAVQPPPNAVNAEALWEWAKEGLQEFFLPAKKG
jgi:hypothetical protein